jgi:nicotinic acid phosphoribosyltransferase
MVTITTVRSSPAGGNYCAFFALGTNAFATISSHVEDHTKSTKTTGHPNRKDLKIYLDALHGVSAFEAFLTTYLTNVDYTAVSDTYEDGTVETASNAETDKMFGYILYFGKNSTTRKVLYGVGVLTGDTGNYEAGNKMFEKSPVEITAVP